MITNEIRLKIRSLAYGGDGVGTAPDGKICFVTGALPGESVTARITQDKNRFSRASVCDVETPSSGRREPECPLFPRPENSGQGCPGCAYLHAVYPLELDWKQRQFTDFLTRSHLCSAGEILPPFAAPERFHYRNKITLHADAEGRWGYVGADNCTIIPLSGCLLAHGEINRAIAELPPAPGGSVTLRYTRKDGVTVLPEGHTSVHRDWLTEELEHWGTFKVPADGFFQVNAGVADELVRRVVDAIERSGAKKLVELYCGVGLFSLAAARKIPDLQCVGVEINKNAIPAARFNARKCGMDKRCRFLGGDAGKCLADISVENAAVLLDPPRTGLSGSVLKTLAASDASAILYVSCAPDTLQRDLQKFQESRWRVQEAGMLDMFPGTAHFESFVILGKEKG